MATKKKELTAHEAEQSIGYGFSKIINDLLTSIDRPITNSDQFKTYYKDMVSNDETISTALEYLTGGITAKIGSYVHNDERIQELVERSIESVRGTMTEIRRSILRDSFAYGFGIGEFTIKAENSSWLLSSIQILDPTSVELRMTQFEDNSYGVGAVVQKAGFNDVEVPAGKCIIKTYGDSTTPYGRSLLRRCYRWWSFKKAIPKLWAVALERFGMPILHAKTHGNTKAVDNLKVSLANLESRSYIVTDTETEINAVSSTGVISDSYSLAEEYCDKMIYRAMFLPPLLGAGEYGGSYSLGKVHMDQFDKTVTALAVDYIDTELECLWRPLIEWNFGPQDNYGNFIINDLISSDEKKILSEMTLNLANSGVIDPDSDRNWIREQLGLPEADENAVFPRWQLENQKYENSEENLSQDAQESGQD